ncbi:MAG: formylglycine-generating enzyme family protein [Bradymonadia bacterium]
MRTHIKRFATRSLTPAALLALSGVAIGGCAAGQDPPAATTAIFIEGGQFTMGSTDADPCDVTAVASNGSLTLSCDAFEQSETLTTEVAVSDFCIDQHEVTVLQYRHCVAREECSKPKATGAGQPGSPGAISKYYSNDDDAYDAFPVLGVTHEQAEAYCRFRGGRLPTEAEWEFAARSRGDASRTTVWENPDLALDRCGPSGDGQARIAYGNCSGNEPLPALSPTDDRTEQGVIGMGSNAAEWVADSFDFLAYCDPDQAEANRGDFYETQGNQGSFPVPKVDALIADMAGDSPRLSSAATCVDVPSGETGHNQFDGGCLDRFGVCQNECKIDSDERDPKETCANSLPVAVTGDPCSAEDADNFCANPDEPMTPVPCADFGLCECVTELADLANNKTTCLQSCYETMRSCITTGDAACLEPEARVACVNNGGSPLFTGVCRASGTADSPAQDPKLTEAREDVLDGYFSFRGGQFQDTREKACELRTTTRHSFNVHSQNIGFRCAYNVSAPACSR